MDLMMTAIISIVLGTAALLARAGLALLHTGLARSKNAASTMLRGVCDACTAALAFWAIGAAILLRTHGTVIGIDPRLLIGWSGFAPDALIGLVCAMIASGIVVGTLIERTRFAALWPASVLTAGIIVPIAGYWAWSGWLRDLGFIDVAGASVVHVGGAMVALVGAILVGPRGGKYNYDGSANMIPGHNLTLAAAGTLLAAVGWLPYVLASTLRAGGSGGFDAATAINVVLAGAAGALASLLYGRLRFGNLDALLTYGGLLGGLVAISAGAAGVNSASAVVIGAAAGILVPFATFVIDLRFRVDDPAGAIAIHGVAGAWGTLAAALFAPLPIAQRLPLLGVQSVGVISIAVLALLLSLALFATLRAMSLLRTPEADEYDGLDLAEHDINAYPDFQQTMIKSYHLREA